MDVWWVTAAGAEQRAATDLPALLGRGDGLVWVDIPQWFLEQMFRTRYGLVAVRTMAAVSREIYGRLATVGRGVPPTARPLLDDTVDQFSRIHAIADGQKEYLQGVIDFYRTRSDIKMTVAAERLAVIAVVTLPVT